MTRPLRPRRNGSRSKLKSGADTGPAVTGATSRPAVTLWAHTYQIVPRQTRRQMRAVRALLDEEHSAAVGESGTFAGRLIVGRQLTRILIVSDCPDRSCAANRRLESELKELRAEFTVSEPVLLADEAATPSPAPTSTLGAP